MTSLNIVADTPLQQLTLTLKSIFLCTNNRLTPFATANKHTIRYDTIRDAILTCAGKPTWVSLIYRTETTTEKCETEKLKSKTRICSEVTVNSPGNPCNQS